MSHASNERPLEALFDPASVAIVGASEDPRKWGNWLARGALRGESSRPVFLVNHRTDHLLGRTAYPSLSHLPEPAELVVVAVPLPALEPTVHAALEAGARAIVAISAGSNDQGDAATATLEETLTARVRAAGAVLLGPNSLGVLDSHAQLELVPSPLPAGSIGLISQSGNLALELGLLAEPNRLGFSRFASLGNQADIAATELIEEFAVHEETRLIALYIEDFRDGRAFARAAAAASASGKPVVALAIGHTNATARAVRSHTGALASDSAAINAAFAAAGIERARTPRELIDIAQALLRSRPARGRRVAVLADGGGSGSIAAAVATEAGLEVPELTPATALALRDELPAGAGVTNPVDLASGAERDVHTFDRVARRLLLSGEIDSLLISGFFGGYGDYGPSTAAEEVAAAEEIGVAARTAQRPVVVHTMYPHSLAAEALRDTDVAVYETVDQATQALARIATRAERSAYEVPRLISPATPVVGDGYEAARAVLEDAGIRFVLQRTVSDRSDALDAASELGYPVVLKALGLLHKSDAGGVAVGLAAATDVVRAFDDMQRRLSPARFSVERVAPVETGLELLIGSRWDARFGPVALAGSGGVYAEILRDTAVALAPLTDSQAEAMLRSLRAAPMLTGARGGPRLDVSAAARALVQVSEVAASHPELAEIEINPLLVTATGVLALDARLVRATTATQEPTKCSSPTPPSNSRCASAPAA